MPATGFEHAIPGSKRPPGLALLYYIVLFHIISCIISYTILYYISEFLTRVYWLSRGWRRSAETCCSKEKTVLLCKLDVRMMGL